ncbi:hypothetical protein Ancab_001252 [Ancistrocladus abbreviatus]
MSSFPVTQALRMGSFDNGSLTEESDKVYTESIVDGSRDLTATVEEVGTKQARSGKDLPDKSFQVPDL